MKTTRGMRLHVGFFGKRNAGKSTVMNKIIGQELSIVSDVKGTTTDVNQKAMELLPVGPIVLLDTAGIDDTGELGGLRVEKTMKVLKRCDVIVFVADWEKLTEIEKDFVLSAKKGGAALISVINKTDEGTICDDDFEFLKNASGAVLQTSGITKDNFISEFKSALLKVLPDDYVNAGVIMSDIVKPDETCILVIPIDKEAPKGRIILPQVNTLREMLNNNSISVVCTENSLKNALGVLKTHPKLVVTDSQAFMEVAKTVPDNVMLTSFSILFARLKGDLNTFYEGAGAIDTLREGDKILILESCSHHPVEDDIGRAKIPRLIENYSSKNLVFEHFSGHDFPKTIQGYSLIIHCGACMTNRREVLNRIAIARKNGVPMTNYGIAIAKCTGILERAMRPLKGA